MNFPETYRCERGLKIIKFERNYQSSLEYEFIGAYPISVSSMPVSYDSSNLLKCSVSMTYLRYVMKEITQPSKTPQPAVASQKSDKPNTQEPPVAQEKESKVSDGYPTILGKPYSVFLDASGALRDAFTGNLI